MTKVKICGIRLPEHALVAATAGADYVGMIFADSRRRVTIEQGAAIVDAVRTHFTSSRPLLVGVFANQPADEINAVADACRLDLIQLSGDELWDMSKELNRPVIKAMRVAVGRTSQSVIAELDKESSPLLHAGGRCLLESLVDGQFGGTGQGLDLSIAKDVARNFPILLAGGLTPENVGDAVRTVRPWGVDVSSGVETDGVKDTDKIRAFITAVKVADAAQEKPTR